MPVDLGSLAGEERTLAEIKYKLKMIGNIKFVGALLARRMLASKVSLAVAEELLSDPTPEALESLAALLTKIGPTLDRQDWAHYTAFNAIFVQVRATVKKPLDSRIRCLLQDLLELRENDWQ